MIKPILYHSFEEKEVLERDLMAKIPLDKIKAVSKTLADIFSDGSKKIKRKDIQNITRKTTRK